MKPYAAAVVVAGAVIAAIGQPLVHGGRRPAVPTGRAGQREPVAQLTETGIADSFDELVR